MPIHLCYSSEAPSCIRRKIELSSQFRLPLSINVQLTPDSRI
uniref:Uncharacterized protein n=1 Tax=Microviridae sp. ctX401 TaxID=2827644 RepID=A0A8S5TLZ1_9VIRU|nr:MAG TPA: hypothetical protein [Microviridae sp. ctX401]